ncbi:pimeloyl-ACP methyl ester carboxylesterase [Rhodopseudomonas faecalis]|uniref:Pimeloyl-ACP methyl ester carboxylesterase n=1 Tax=Rhodopseudomonas faecalis TaxID=99655 RepID=A0A318TDQ1_9BRAD|nr:alpha/beta hydrolase [Rhodopseudomonas faecalis]PYF01927.1 pimeloyl-ACP methyl ester carboxylesterase [Rhodopseudomonas faecalis]
MSVPESRFYQSHGLNLHYADWGNDGAPPLLLAHGGRDHGRSWDRIATALQPHYHVLAPDLRGHGDSDWTRGGSYSLPEYVYDLRRLAQQLGDAPLTLIGHSMGGMVASVYAGAFPAGVAKLVIIDGITVLPSTARTPAPERLGKWVSDLERLEQRTPRRFATLADAAAQLRLRNPRLAPELADHLAKHGTRLHDDGRYGWKFDPCQRVMAPHRLWPQDYIEFWTKISCPTLLLRGADSALGDPAAAGITRYFHNAHVETISNAGHWLHHDQPQHTIELICRFLGQPAPAL